MAITFDPECQTVVNRAKASLPPGQPVGVQALLGALAHHPAVRQRFGRLAEVLPEPAAPDAAPDPGPRAVEPALRLVLGRLGAAGKPITVWVLLAGLLSDAEGERVLRAAGLPDAPLAVLREELGSLVGPAGPATAGARDAEREAGPVPGPATAPDAAPRPLTLAERLARFGRVLTAGPLPAADLRGREALLGDLCRSLIRLKHNNALLVGPHGVGKTTIAMELFRRIAAGLHPVPPALQGRVVVEVPTALLRERAERSDAVALLGDDLREAPRAILFVEDAGELLLQRERGSDRGRAGGPLLSAAIEGATPFLGCITPREARDVLRDPRWRDQFDLVQVDEPRPDAVAAVVTDALPEYAAHYAPLEIPAEVVPEVVRGARLALASVADPARSLRFLDEVCSVCAASEPPIPRVSREAVGRALSERGLRLGPGREPLTEAEVLRRLAGRIAGQDDVLREISRAFVAGLSDWARGDRPRGVFLFGGPTGVGKTETAAALATLLDPSPQGLIRVNCNVLQGGHQGKESVLWPLLGVPAGFVGHGDGGLLSPVREHPDCVVLFDEFEKADPAVGKMLLQILDTGQQEDNDGNLLDFRRAFLVFTTNLGCDYEAGAAIGFGGRTEGLAVPTVDRKAIFDELLSMGYGHEFLGRIQDTFLFRGLGADAIREIVGRLLERLTREAGERGYALSWDPRVPDDVVARWRPRLGVRHLHGLLLFRVRQALALAEAEGRLEGVKEVRLVLPGDAQVPRSDRFDLVVE